MFLLMKLFAEPMVYLLFWLLLLRELGVCEFDGWLGRVYY